MGSDVVIAIDLISSGASFRRAPRTAVGMLFSSAMMLMRSASTNQKYKADVTITPRIAHIRPDRMRQRDECLALGEAAVRERIDEIKELIRG
jgi:hypothetical protein